MSNVTEDNEISMLVGMYIVLDLALDKSINRKVAGFMQTSLLERMARITDEPAEDLMKNIIAPEAVELKEKLADMQDWIDKNLSSEPLL